MPEGAVLPTTKSGNTYKLCLLDENIKQNKFLTWDTIDINKHKVLASVIYQMNIYKLISVCVYPDNMPWSRKPLIVAKPNW